jgi:hypothetical protein
MKNPKNSKKAILQTLWTVTLHPLAERELQTTPRSAIETALKRLEEST